MLQESFAQVVKGYELREQINEGGYGVVYRAYQSLVGRDVAVKIIRPQYANHPDFIRRFEWEAQLVARLEHPYIVPLYDYWRDPDGAFLVMRWLRGGNLHDLLHNRPLPTELLGRLIEQVGSALALAHRRGVVHRDLKPANILLDEEGNAYLADFGIAKDLGARVSPYQTDASTVIGSPAYISPEQVRAEPITFQTDIYSLGVMLYEILTGQLPFRAPTPIALMFMHVNEPVPTVRTQRPDLSDAVNMVIQKATAKRPTDRYADVITLIQELRQALASSPAVTGRLTDALPTPSQPEDGNRTTSGMSTRSKYETGVLYLPAPVAAPIEAPIESPYKGLRAFQEADADDFFGRERLTQLLLTRMQEQVPLERFLAVVGPSGSGKSSVVRAGLAPALRRGRLPGSQNWFVVEMFPGAHPIEELAQALMRVAVEPPNNLVAPLMLDDQGLLRVVDQVVPGADETEVVLVIDQFEEVFTLVEDEAERTHFLNSLINAVTDPYSRVRVIVTLRADFYDRPLLYPGFSELMRQRTEVVVPLAPEELKQAIISPAERHGLRVDPELVEAIVSDVAEQPGALPLLQYALTEVFERRTGRTLTLTPYNASGGVLGALARRAEEIYTGLRAEQQEAARQLFLRLVTLGEGVEDTRRRVRRTELAFINHREHKAHGAKTTGSALAIAEKAALDAVIDTYSQYRLLTRDNDPATRAPTVEVAHEALIRTWTRLRQWLDASRDDLRLQRRMTTAAAEWAASGHDRSFLASGARLEQLASWANETPLALNAEERDYLGASLTERDAQRAQEQARKVHEATLERRSRTFLRALAAVLLVAFVLALGLSIYTFQQQREAQSERDKAEQSANSAATAKAEAQGAAYIAKQNEYVAVTAQAQAQQEANTRATAEAETRHQLATRNAQRLALEAQSLAPNAPERALLLAYEAAAQYHDPLTEQALRDIVDRIRWSPTVFRGHTAAVNNAVFSPDEQYILTASDDHTARLWDRAGNQLVVFNGHAQPVGNARFSPDGQRILTISEDNTARLWDRAGNQLAIFNHTGALSAGIFSPDGQHILTTSQDRTARLWDLAGTAIVTFTGHTEVVRNPSFSRDGQHILTASNDQTARLWDLTGKSITTFTGHTGRVTSAVFSPDGQRVLTTSEDQTARLWDLAGIQLVVFKGHTDRVTSALFSPDGQRILTQSQDRTARLWDLAGNQLAIFNHTDRVVSVAFSPDGQRVLTGSVDATARLWDLSGRQLAILSHTSRVPSAKFSRDGQRILTASQDKTARLWVAVGPPLATIGGQAMNVIDARYSPDGRHILTMNSDQTAQLWDRAGNQIAILKGHTDKLNDAEFSSDGQRIVTASADGTARLWDLAGNQLAVCSSHTDRVNKALFSPDGQRILTMNSDRTAQLWDLAGHQLAVFSGHAEQVNTVAFSPDGQYVLTASLDKTARLWDLNGTAIVTFTGHSDSVQAATFSPDGQYILTTSFDNTARLWDRAGKVITIFKGHSDRVTGGRFSSDGQQILTRSRDQTARLWDLTGKVIATFQGHAGRVTTAVFSPDGHYVLTASADNTARLWDLSGKPIVTLQGHTNVVNSAEFSADGQRILTTSADGMARQYLVDMNELLAVAACRVGRGLTEDEVASFGVDKPTFDMTKRQCPPVLP